VAAAAAEPEGALVMAEALSQKYLQNAQQQRRQERQQQQQQEQQQQQQRW
jgi:hypothetical protein